MTRRVAEEGVDILDYKVHQKSFIGNFNWLSRFTCSRNSWNVLFDQEAVVRTKKAQWLLLKRVNKALQDIQQNHSVLLVELQKSKVILQSSG